MSAGARWRLPCVLAASAIVLAACASPLSPPPAPAVAEAERQPRHDPGAGDPGPSGPRGEATAAVPDPVGVWWQASAEDVGAGDLAPLWSLPLYRTDHLGRAVPALAIDARAAETPDGWSVEVDLASGEWSDGEPVGAHDVVATAEALAAVRPAEWAAWVGAEALDEDTVRLEFDREFGGWAELLSRPPGVLPAHVLAEDGLDGYRDALPVTGGWFTLGAHEPGLRARFVAAAASPLGSPGLRVLEVLVVPDHDTALGLLDDGEVDVVLGHVALDPSTRRDQVPGVRGAAVFGGSRFELVWDADGASDRDVRRAAARVLDAGPFVDGLLRDAGRPAGGLLPALEAMPRATTSDATGAASVQVVRTVEGLGLLARRLQADLVAAGVATTLVRVDPPQHLDEPLETDGRLRLVRVGPRRSLAALLAGTGFAADAGSVVQAALAADAAAAVSTDPGGARVSATGARAAVAAALADDPWVLPLAEVAVAHVWAEDRVVGVTPSGWPGIGFWNAGEWQVP